MLTKKQIWRRTFKRPRTRRAAATIDESPPLTKVEINVPTPPQPFKLKSALSSGNLSGMDKQLRNSRVVRFSATVHVLLIPSRLDLLAHYMNIYFTSKDYQMFKREAVNEIHEVARFYSIPVKQAMNKLYQPNFSISTEPTPDLIDDPHRLHQDSLLDTCSSGSLFEASRSALERDLHFIIRAKTDVELNAAPATPDAPDGSVNRAVRRIPIRTTSSAPSRQQQLWAVQWRKQSDVSRGVG